MYLYFLSDFNTEMVQVVQIFPCGRQRFVLSCILSAMAPGDLAR